MISRSSNNREVPAMKPPTNNTHLNLLYTPPFVNPPHDSLLPQVNDRPPPSGGGVRRRKHSVEREREEPWREKAELERVAAAVVHVEAATAEYLWWPVGDVEAATAE
ncbi:hypothetical protein HanRHA438_Chr14g0664901 [Helianthus annuus]|uniref:Uncharacterized protein n=1 Tax=Helianthus annuus TaxID=4232 RepID=A0A251SJ40_HELAN|nr:hypothetical protein HanXRQr2_Chr14g0654121 [Helianthus annuus]KAJ0464910.1 hypothetical protein HanHA300_Chr14g0532541 [Helianthus annuus]KAJ0486502.1 hypothetical protein HanHA89_Chr14g0580351 [Helianthus annuus]KAJ0657068.1 hypothetical protein HanLR1_Chr14g0542931 [Helianthus annuus]KAJ0660649.1 hypothetical protein HanOQP8_Chr14g0540091 [Helianthus annuus]